MHRTGIGNAGVGCRQGLPMVRMTMRPHRLGRSRLFQICRWIGLEFRLAAVGAKDIIRTGMGFSMLGGRWIDRHATHGINHLQAVLMAAACAMTRSTSGRRRIWVRLRRCGQLLCHGLKLIPISPNSTATSSVIVIGRAPIPLGKPSREQIAACLGSRTAPFKEDL
jgi:hypothetical protein